MIAILNITGICAIQRADLILKLLKIIKNLNNSFGTQIMSFYPISLFLGRSKRQLSLVSTIWDSFEFFCFPIPWRPTPCLFRFNETYFWNIFLLNTGKIECFVSKAAIKITEAAIHRCLLKKAKRRQNLDLQVVGYS